MHYIDTPSPRIDPMKCSWRASPAVTASSSSSTASSIIAILLAALIAVVAPGAVGGVKLASLGSTLEGNNIHASAGGAAAGRKALLGDHASYDLASLACSPDYGGGTSSSSSASAPATCSSSYGVDRSFPIHHHGSIISDEDGTPSPFDAGSKREFYEEFMEGCRRRYGPAEGILCDRSEVDRVDMNLRQPSSMHNYTALGFDKVRAPANMMTLLSKFWSKQKFSSSATANNAPNETWPPGDTYTNHWTSPTKMLDLEIAAPSSLRKSIWDATRPVLEEWSGTDLTPTSLYGIRVYSEGAVLAPHVDRMPLVISAVVNVAQDVDEPWPLEVYGHDGNAYNVTLEPGDMVLYESHSVIHGRPFPMKGRYYANVFIHFEPLGHTLQHEESYHAEDEESLEYLYKQAWKKLQTKCSDDEECQARVDLNVAEERRAPHYIVPGSEEERRWMQTHPKARLDLSKDNDWVRGLNAHTAASSGDLDALLTIAKDNPDALHHKDNNGWNPLHEAVRGGHVGVVKYLLKNGLDKDERTHTGDGGSPLWWAKKTHGLKHPMVHYLEGIGAKEVPPNGHKKIFKESDRED